jgi:hypothetical protein
VQTQPTLAIAGQSVSQCSKIRIGVQKSRVVGFRQPVGVVAQDGPVSLRLQGVANESLDSLACSGWCVPPMRRVPPLPAPAPQIRRFSPLQALQPQAKDFMRFVVGQGGLTAAEIVARPGHGVLL